MKDHFSQKRYFSSFRAGILRVFFHAPLSALFFLLLCLPLCGGCSPQHSATAFDSGRAVQAARPLEAPYYNGQWAHTDSDLPPDPGVTFGTLSNGFRYAVIPHVRPEGRVSLYLDVQAGALMEEAGQYGYAHFVEHMAFNGTRNFAPGALVPFFQQNGMGFGNDSNAHTGQAETVYKLNLASTDEAAVQTGLSILRDFADGLLFDSAEVADEIGVILAEKNSRENESVQAVRRMRQALYAGTRFANEPIGVEADIAAASSGALLDFYTRWYHPERMILVVAGDIVPGDIVPLVETAFAAMGAPGSGPGTVPAAPDIPYWGDPVVPGTRFFYQPRPVSVTTVNVIYQHPRIYSPDSKALQLRELTGTVLNYCLRQRLQERRESGQSEWLGAGAVVELETMLPVAMLGATAAGEGWRVALRVLNEEMRRVVQYGISQPEIEHALEAYRQAYERGVQEYQSQPNDAVAATFVLAANSGRVFTSPSYDLELFTQLAPHIGPREVHELARHAFSAESLFISVSGDAVLPDGEDDIRTVWEQANTVAVAAYDRSAQPDFPYLAVPADIPLLPEITVSELAGKDVPEHVVRLSLHSARLENGVELYLLPSPLEKDQITASIMFGSGTRALPDALFPLMRMSTAVMHAGGLGRLSALETRRLFAGRGLGVVEGYYPHFTEIRGFSRTEDLETLLLALWTQYNDPQPQEIARGKILQSLEYQQYQRFHSVDGVDGAEGLNYFYGTSRRFSALEYAEARGYTLDDIRRFVNTTRQNAGPFRIIISGDFYPETALPVLARLFSTLSVQPAPLPDQCPMPSFPAVSAHRMHVDDTVDKAVVRMAWRLDLPGERDRRTYVARRLLASVMRDRLRRNVREQLGAAYSPAAYYRYLPDDGGYGLFIMEAGTGSGHVDIVRDGFYELAADLQANGVSTEELERLKLPLLTTWRTSLGETATLHALLENQLQRGLPYLEWIYAYGGLLQSISVDEVNAQARAAFSATQQAELVIFSGSEAGAKEEKPLLNAQ